MRHVCKNTDTDVITGEAIHATSAAAQKYAYMHTVFNKEVTAYSQEYHIRVIFIFENVHYHGQTVPPHD